MEGTGYRTAFTRAFRVQRTAFRKNTSLDGGGGEFGRTAFSVQPAACRKSAISGAGVAAGLVGGGGEFG